ncbi:MAG: molybdopterin-dependent oxidoreductase [Proteobacteria bacterium]|nr:molybdopterin-dependent oxidoreductase [Pseudomonadota bacterium]MBU4259333.1 molybdopterin-dependent oxidoreductase [Pseudomonadota bacterium]MBU4287062.1 molybdopterin-dependent oxidoreductase [Pseudomonadota bacterium]MBU4414054.1 molybdopterin-dependent oxidoreductase [Pseudomonadota bacterium]MCG2757558.1 molybdopterin-dependent oxidoreductase [Desulfobacteraceae bacterium]
MKIGRRSFLSFVIGGAAGTAITPLPWKLMDDVSIWSQNWPWTPVPPDGEYSYVNSVCALCPGGCGITVRKVDDRAVKIEGMKGYPVNDGGICVLGLSGLQLLYGPTRVKSPLKRAGERGEGKWEKISWDEAIFEVTKKLSDIRSNGESHAVGSIVSSDSGTVPNLFKRFLTAYGSPNFMTMPSIQDSYEMTMQLMQGVSAKAGFDAENADFILSFGSGIIDGWGSPVRMFKANSAWKANGKKVIQIEPRLSNTAAKSDKWIPIKPGTEAALALGLANVIIKESLYNKEKIDSQSGFDAFKKLVLNEYSTDKVSNITGINSTAIVSLAKTFARASKPLAICGRGQGSIPGSLNEFMAVHALNALVGNINKKGGVWAVPETDYIKWSKVEMDETATNGVQKERIDGAGSEYPHAKSLLNRLAEVINSGDGALEALFVAGANPLYSMPDSKAIKKAFGNIAFVVSFSSYMDETASNADLILPNHVYLERYEDVPTPAGLQKNVIGLTRPVVKPQFNTKNVGDTIILIAKALGGRIADAFPWNSYEACLEETLGAKWGELVENGFCSDSNSKVATGKFDFYPKAMESLSDFSPVNVEGSMASYPLVLIPYDSIRLSNGYIGDPPFVIKTVEDTVLKGKYACVDVNPKTGKEIGLTEGGYASIHTPRGRAVVKVHLYEGIMPGIVALPRGLGHTAYDKYLAGKGCNFNELIGPVEDPVSGFDAAWGIRARLTKV